MTDSCTFSAAAGCPPRGAGTSAAGAAAWHAGGSICWTAEATGKRGARDAAPAAGCPAARPAWHAALAEKPTWHSSTNTQQKLRHSPRRQSSRPVQVTDRLMLQRVGPWIVQRIWGNTKLEPADKPGIVPSPSMHCLSALVLLMPIGCSRWSIPVI